MSAPEASSDSRRRPLLRTLFWVGVGLAPIAALSLLLAQGDGLLRIAAVLAVLAVVLIGLSTTLRSDSETVRLEMEETLLDEIDTLREELRHEIATAARATHRAFGEKLQAVQDNVEALRGPAEAGRVEAPRGRAGYDQSPPPTPAPVAANGSASPVPGAGHYAVPNGQRGTAGQQPQPGAAAGGRASVPVAAIPVPRAPVSGGPVRHTETGQVTTRHTVDPQHEDPHVGRVYGGASGHAAEPPGGRGAEPAPMSQRGRRTTEADEDPWGDQLRPEPRGGEGRGRRSYDDGPRIEERWAAVRREEPRREGRRRDGGGRDDARWRDDPGWRETDWDARGDGADDRGWDPRGTPPAGGVEQPAAWRQGWSEPEREPDRRGRRHRDDGGYGYPPVDDAPRAGGRMEYEYSDDRWR